MGYIGKVIKELRTNSNLTRQELAENICTVKYIYLIEKGERSPSVETLILFGEKLGMDLFNIYPFLPCREPVKVYDFFKKFELYRECCDYKKLNLLTDNAEELYDFQKSPWKNEIFLNRFMYRIFFEKDFTSIITEISEILKNSKRNKMSNLYLLQYSILLEVCYRFTGQTEKAYELILKNKTFLNEKFSKLSYKSIVVSELMNEMTFYFFVGNYEKAIETGFELIEYQNMFLTYKISPYLPFFISFSYHELKLKYKALDWFKKALYLTILYDLTAVIEQLLGYPAFYALLNYKEIDKSFIDDFNKKYNLNKNKNNKI